jgi:hypothetical protein
MISADGAVAFPFLRSRSLTRAFRTKHSDFTTTALGARAFARFDATLRERGYLEMGGQIVDATVIEARRPRLNQDEKQAVPGGQSAERLVEGAHPPGRP